MLSASTLGALTGLFLLYHAVGATSVSERPPIRLSLVREDKTCVDANSLHATFACADFDARRNGWSLYGNGGEFLWGMLYLCSSFSHTERN